MKGWTFSKLEYLSRTQLISEQENDNKARHLDYIKLDWLTP